MPLLKQCGGLAPRSEAGQARRLFPRSLRGRPKATPLPPSLRGRPNATSHFPSFPQELRFIIYVFPMVTLAAAVACERLWRSKRFTWFLRLAVVGLVACSLAATGVFMTAAVHNYPGEAAGPGWAGRDPGKGEGTHRTAALLLKLHRPLPFLPQEAMPCASCS